MDNKNRLPRALSRSNRKWVVPFISLLLCSITVTVNAATPASVGAYVRIDQVGYGIDESKVAFLIASTEVGTSSFQVETENGKVVYRGSTSKNEGAWSKPFEAVYPLDFSHLKTPGRYHVVVDGQVHAVSPTFTIESNQDLMRPLIENSMKFFEAQRDGLDVISSVMNRSPSHLTDKQAQVFATPNYQNDVLQSDLMKIGEPIDASGGWFDAGDYLKFVETASYSDAIMLLVARQDASRYPMVFSEAEFGLNWLMKMWDDKTRTLYYQVGIGNGNGSTINGDHDLWRLPQADDKLNVAPGDPNYYVKYRPVFRAGPPGTQISPNLAGRVTADFALAAQVYANRNHALAEQFLSEARHVYELANTQNVGQLTTAVPYDYYSETNWKDDMELGSTELTLADLSLNAPQTFVASDLRNATRWAKAYMSQQHDDGDTLNLYDDSAIAHAELISALREVDGVTGLSVTQGELLNDLTTQIQIGKSYAAQDPFDVGVNLGHTDAVPHAFGLAATVEMYERLSGDHQYDTFGIQQRNWALGANPWGSSFVIGDGTVFPREPHSQIANLEGSLSGKPPILTGATVDGPSAISDFASPGLEEGMRNDSSYGDPFKLFNARGVGYMDNVVDWPSVEPTDDYTVISLLDFALTADNTLMSGSVVTNASATSGFSDVLSTDANYKYIVDLQQQDKIQGEGNNQFAPNDPLTRAEFVTMIERAFNLPSSSVTLPFKDVNSSDWFYAHVRDAYAMKITNGTSATTFSPNQTLMREEAATMIWNYLTKNNLITVKANASRMDASDADSWAIGGVQNILAYNFRSDSNSRYNSKAVMKRGDAAALIDTVLNTIGSDSTTPGTNVWEVGDIAPKPWSEIKSFAYQLQNVDLDAIRSAPYDLVIIDFSSNGMESGRFTKEQIESLKSGPHPKKVLAYMSIGEAENYRWYWQNDWVTSPPAWLGPENPNWKGNFEVKYWDSDWQKLIYGTPSSYLDKIIDAGFDGVYLDIIDGYEFWGPDGESGVNHVSAEQDMVDFVEKIANYARVSKNKPDFGVVPQNGEGLSSYPDYVATVTGIGKEDTWTNGNNLQSIDYTKDVLNNLDIFKKSGKLVLCTDYPTDSNLSSQFVQNATAKGYIPYVAPRLLDSLANRIP